MDDPMERLVRSLKDDLDAALAREHAARPVLDAAAELRTYWLDWPEERRQKVRALSQYVHAAAERIAAESDTYCAALSAPVEAGAEEIDAAGATPGATRPACAPPAAVPSVTEAGATTQPDAFVVALQLDDGSAGDLWNTDVHETLGEARAVLDEIEGTGTTGRAVYRLVPAVEAGATEPAPAFDFMRTQDAIEAALRAAGHELPDLADVVFVATEAVGALAGAGAPAEPTVVSLDDLVMTPEEHEAAFPGEEPTDDTDPIGRGPGWRCPACAGDRRPDQLPHVLQVAHEAHERARAALGWWPPSQPTPTEETPHA